MALEDPISEEREEKMISGDCNPTVRNGRFLKPCADCPEKAASVPHVPLLFETMSQNLTKWPSEVLFKGCKSPHKKWKQWVDRVATKHEPTWKKAGIYDAIMSSTYEIQLDRVLVLGLSEFWCADINTFVFPWGEATITLEDMLILGGLSVLGQPINIPLTDTLKKIEDDLKTEHRGLNHTRAKKASHSGWINRFMGSEGESETELEHVALLVLWLSRHCFPSHPKEVVRKNVFSIAIHLSQGTRLALAPAVLASLYKDLRFMKEQVYAYEAKSLHIWAPFQLLQFWAWERFSVLRPIEFDPPRPWRSGEPRVIRWQKPNPQLKFKLNLQGVRSILKEFDMISHFLWRPYVEEELIDNELQTFRSFVRCLRSCELVGLDYVEKYLPHRVARQFGFDQDLPGHFSRAESDRKIAWSSYDSRLYSRSRLINAECTERYSDWWKQNMLVRTEAIKDVLEKRHPPGFAPKEAAFGSRKHCDAGDNKEDYDPIPAPRKRKTTVNMPVPTRIDDDDELTLSQKFGFCRSSVKFDLEEEEEETKNNTPVLISIDDEDDELTLLQNVPIRIDSDSDSASDDEFTLSQKFKLLTKKKKSLSCEEVHNAQTFSFFGEIRGQGRRM